VRKKRKKADARSSSHTSVPAVALNGVPARGDSARALLRALSPGAATTVLDQLGALGEVRNAWKEGRLALGGDRASSATDPVETAARVEDALCTVETCVALLLHPSALPLRNSLKSALSAGEARLAAFGADPSARLLGAAREALGCSVASLLSAAAPGRQHCVELATTILAALEWPTACEALLQASAATRVAAALLPRRYHTAATPLPRRCHAAATPRCPAAGECGGAGPGAGDVLRQQRRPRADSCARGEPATGARGERARCATRHPVHVQPRAPGREWGRGGRERAAR